VRRCRTRERGAKARELGAAFAALPIFDQALHADDESQA
jgi:hypothetical protein